MPAATITWAQIPPETVFPGITRQVVHGERQTMIRYVYAPGSIFPVHAHAEEQITIVVSGTIRFDLDGNRIELGPGDIAIIPPNVPHGATVTGDEVVETFNAFSPRRAASPFAGTTEGKTIDRE